jgi:hypothetical protein
MEEKWKNEEGSRTRRTLSRMAGGVSRMGTVDIHKQG